MNFQDQLKSLHKEAKAHAKLREEAAAEAKARKAAEESAETSFAEAMKGVQPIKPHNQYIPPRDKSPIKPRPKQADAEQDNLFFVGEGSVQLEIPATFSKNGQGANDIKRLQSGYYEVVADVDLHGYTPVLKSLVRRWLMAHPDVLAYCEPHKNNDGAVRILVKRRRAIDPFAE